MEWIKTALPLLGVMLGWVLSESSKIFTDKRQDKRKLKKLLFFLLELRYHFAGELSFELDLDKYINLAKTKLAVKFSIDKNHPDFIIAVDTWKPFLQNLLAKTKFHEDNFEYLNSNIDTILIELAEIFPILAYELNGQHNIKERLNRANNYFGEIEKVASEIPFDIKSIIQPRLTKELLEDLDDSIEKIASKIDKETLQLSKHKISIMKFQDNDTEIEKVMDEFIDKFYESINNTIAN